MGPLFPVGFLLCLYIYKSSFCRFLPFYICLSIQYLYLPVYLADFMSVCLSVCLSLYLSVYLLLHLSVCFSICLSVCFCLFPPVCLSLSVCVSVSLSLSPSIPVYMSLFLSVCLSFIIWSPCLYGSLSNSVCLFVSWFLSFSDPFYLSFSVLFVSASVPSCLSHCYSLLPFNCTKPLLALDWLGWAFNYKYLRVFFTIEKCPCHI
jgi:hypothetical protein